MSGSKLPARNNGTAFSGDSASKVSAATHLKRASVLVSSLATATNTGTISPRLTTGT